jgi:hypothetical protein
MISMLKLALAICLCAMPFNAGYGAGRDDDGALVPEGLVEQPLKPKREPPAEADDDEELLDAVSPRDKNAGSEEVDRLERAINGMWNSKKRVAGSDTGRETQEIQNQIVKDLEQLLALLKKQQQNRQNSPQPNRNQGQNGDQSPNDRQKTQKGQTDPQNSGAKSEPQGGRRNEGQSSDSEERTDPARLAAAEEARRARMSKDVWGHLPPHLRTAMQNAFSENYLPRYEELVKKYYESLAEKNRKRQSRGETRISP